ncbi:MAG: peptide chain release factor N(5)-glutamine methyltransferase [bacterium]
MKIIDIWKKYGYNYETNLLILEILKIKKSDLYIKSYQEIEFSKLNKFDKLYERLKQDEPIQYIIGKSEFMNNWFFVNSNVLIPRPETEILTKVSLKIAKHFKNGFTIFDLGTGSGNIIISLAKRLKNKDINFLASDISKKALKIAYKNSLYHKVEKKITFLCGNLWKALKNHNQSQKINMIISNPPYISNFDYENLELKVKNYEPSISLKGRENGLYFLKNIIKNAPNYLAFEGYLILEIGMGQEILLEKIIKKMNIYSKLKIVKDKAGINRIIVLQL